MATRRQVIAGSAAVAVGGTVPASASIAPEAPERFTVLRDRSQQIVLVCMDGREFPVAWNVSIDNHGVVDNLSGWSNPEEQTLDAMAEVAFAGAQVDHIRMSKAAFRYLMRARSIGAITTYGGYGQAPYVQGHEFLGYPVKVPGTALA